MLDGSRGSLGMLNHKMVLMSWMFVGGLGSPGRAFMVHLKKLCRPFGKACVFQFYSLVV